MKKFIFVYLLLAGMQKADAQDYFLGQTKDNISQVYMMSATINRTTHVIEVFDRIKPAAGQLAAFRKQMIEARQNVKLGTDGFEKLAYYRRKIEYNCKGHKFRQMECTYYDLNGKEIDSDPRRENTKWEDVPAATLREMEFNKVCK